MSDGTPIEPPEHPHHPAESGAPVFETRQIVLMERLASKDERLSRMYGGALAAMARQDAESLAQSAHSMRELLEKLPTYFEAVPEERGGPTLKESATTLVQGFERAKRASRTHADGSWQGEIDAPLRKLLAKSLPAFAGRLAAAKPPRRTERSELIRRVDDSPHDMPEFVRHGRVAEWEMYSDYFQGVAHHGHSPEAAEFEATVWQCEKFLLDQLVPRTFADREAIAAIVKEVEHGHPG